MKRCSILLGVLAASVAALWPRVLEDPRARAGDEKEGKKVASIPLKSIYSTGRQEGLKVMDQGQGDQEVRNEMRELHQQAIKMGASNIFLVRGDHIEDAVKATWEVFLRGHGVDEPVNWDWRRKSDKYWLVGYFGVSGSEGPAWLAKSVEATATEIKLTFTNPAALTQDDHPYFFWVPLGKLKPETYTLTLEDGDRQKSLLVRRVRVTLK